MVAMKENSGRQTQFVESSHRGEDILNFIATNLGNSPLMIILGQNKAALYEKPLNDHEEFNMI